MHVCAVKCETLISVNVNIHIVYMLRTYLQPIYVMCIPIWNVPPFQVIHYQSIL